MVCADAWTNQVLARLGVEVPLTVTAGAGDLLRAARPRAVRRRCRCGSGWTSPSYYGFPCYGEPTVKAAQDCGGPPVDPDARTTEPDPEMRDRLAAFLGALLPGSGEPVRSLRCQYTLTPDRDFVLAPVPGHEAVVVGLGVGARLQVRADLRPDPRRPGHDGTVRRRTCRAFGFDRPALTDPDFVPNWMV